MNISVANRLGVAHQLLNQYALQPLLVTFLQYSENITFQVEAEQGDFLLRLHNSRFAPPGARGLDKNTIRSELLWLESLINSGLPVPGPIKTRTGEFVASQEDLHATLLAWQAGEPLTRELESTATAAQIGMLVGRLHAHASQWKLPSDFTRPHYDKNYFKKALATLQPAVEDGRVSLQNYQTLADSLALLTNETDQLPHGQQVEGLLHGDLHRGNFLLHEGQIRLIDFSMCAFGSYAFDLATCLSNVRPAFHPTFLEHYTRFFPLPPNYERLIEGYFLASYISTFSLWVSDAQSQETFIPRVAYIAREYGTRYNRDERFWFV